MKHIILRLCGGLICGFALSAMPQEQSLKLLSIVAVEGAADWQHSGVGVRRLFSGASTSQFPVMIRTAEHGRLVLKIGSATMLRLGADTEVEFVSANAGDFTLRVTRGRVYFLHRESRGQFVFETPGGRVEIEGTEGAFLVSLNGVTTLDLMDGDVKAVNAQGTLPLSGRAAALLEPGKAPRPTAVLEMNRVVQWNLYYPAIVDPDELALDAEARTALRGSLAKYHEGELLAALAAYPIGRQPASRAEALYRVGLLLAIGDVDAARQNLEDQTITDRNSREVLMSIERGLRRLTSLKEGTLGNGGTNAASAAEWLAISYEAQSRTDLAGALKAAQVATEKRPHFSFAHARVAELEFSFGRTRAARLALDRALQLAPRNAQALTTRGFARTAANRFGEAREDFETAIRIDPALGNGWLGRGLCRIHANDLQGGLDDLQTAATVEPTRAVLRSYLAKAFALRGQPDKARAELLLAARWDANDPTAPLYSALLNREQNRVNPAVDDLERSIRLNENRAVYRSEFLLDQDRAVRGANLAAIYREAGLAEVGLREASRAVASDYANSSAHLFLANSYNELRDPGYVGLRYETATFSEYLLANLLSPPGSVALSPQVSQQEYSRLFDRRRLGFTSATAYTSDGVWQQEASQYGYLGRTAYALDAYYRSSVGNAPNTDLEQLALSAQAKHQLTSRDAVYLQAVFNNVESGDTRQYYDPIAASPGLRVKEEQLPNLFAGYHHEWSPGIHTLLLAGWLNDTLKLSEPAALMQLIVKDGSGIPGGVLTPKFRVDYLSEFEAGTVELQQIWQLADHTLVAGGRFQSGETKTHADLSRNTNAFPPVFDAAYAQRDTTELERFSLYAYDNWQLCNSFLVSAGMSYDALSFPESLDVFPVSSGQEKTRRVSPKAGFIWLPGPATSVRGAYTRSLGGLFFDQSVRLEPTQVAGFNQAFRSLIPESVAGALPASEFETFHLGADHRFGSRTYLVVDAAILRSEAEQMAGVFEYFDVFPFVNAAPARTREELEYEERSVSVSVSQLAGEHWVFGTRYRVSHAELERRMPEIEIVAPVSNTSAWLHQVNLFALFNHPRGWFGRAEALWWGQSNDNDAPGPGDDFWQFNLAGGYRFPGRRAEISLGLLNLTDEDYRLNPLNLYGALPRHRTFFASLRFNF